MLNIFLSAYGVMRAYKTRSMILFVWLIVFYYSITSIVTLLEMYEIPMRIKTTYALNMTLCIVAFLFSDLIFNRKKYEGLDLSKFENFPITLKIVEVIFWISIGLTYLELRKQDYSTYNSVEGQAGWSQCLFQVTSCMIIYFLYKKQWWKIVIAALLTVAMVASCGVRSLLYFVLLPIIFFFINTLTYTTGFKKLLKRILPLMVLVGLSVIVVNTLRFNEVKLPETELTEISLNVMKNGGFPLQYFNSLLHYLSGFLPPIINALRLIGISLPMPGSLLLPPIPILDQATLTIYDIDGHMPGTIFHDFYMSYGYYGAIWAFVVFSYLKFVFNFFQKNIASFFAFSSVLGWHVYMLMRGACDSCSGGVAYSVWLGLILYWVITRFRK